MAPAGPAGGAPDRPGAPPTGLAGASLLPLLPLLWYFINSCSLPYVKYYSVFDLISYNINHSLFITFFREKHLGTPCVKKQVLSNAHFRIKMHSELCIRQPLFFYTWGT